MGFGHEKLDPTVWIDTDTDTDTESDPDTAIEIVSRKAANNRISLASN